MGSIRFGAVTFQVYTDDHLPRHVHARYAGIEVIVELRLREALISSRRGATNPMTAKRSDVAYIVRAANTRLKELHQLWEKTHDRP